MPTPSEQSDINIVALRQALKEGEEGSNLKGLCEVGFLQFQLLFPVELVAGRDRAPHGLFRKVPILRAQLYRLTAKHLSLPT